VHVTFLYPLDNIRFFYNPPGADGWPDLERINVRRYVLEWVQKNCAGAAQARFNPTEKLLALSAFSEIEFGLLGRGGIDHELLSTDLSISFALKNDHRIFGEKWGRANWHRSKLFDTKYSDAEFSISSCLWKLKVELSRTKPELFDWVKNNVLGEYEYCTFSENRKCVMGLEFESADDASMFRYVFKT
jgi:hypothetical protein